MRSLFAWVGFPSKVVPYDRAPQCRAEHQCRAEQMNDWWLWNFAIEGITGFTVVPLKLATSLGLLVAVLAAIYLTEVIVKTLLYGNQIAGYPSLMAVVLFLGGARLVTLGFIGEYLGRIRNETKRRPLYFPAAPFHRAPFARPGSDHGAGIGAPVPTGPARTGRRPCLRSSATSLFAEASEYGGSGAGSAMERRTIYPQSIACAIVMEPTAA